MSSMKWWYRLAVAFVFVALIPLALVGCRREADPVPEVPPVEEQPVEEHPVEEHPTEEHPTD